MSIRLDRKIAIITGGLSGIGAAIARRMASEGATVIVADRSAGEPPRGSGESPDPCGCGGRGECGRDGAPVVARYRRLDWVVNSAGIGSDIPFLQTSLETFDRIIAVNLRGTFIAGQAAACAMKETGGGSIVNIAGVSAITGNAGRSAYGASKWGVVGLSRMMGDRSCGL